VEYQNFNIALGTHQLLDPTTDLCTWSEKFLLLHQKTKKKLHKQAVGEQPDVILSSPPEITVVGDLVTTHYEGSSRKRESRWGFATELRSRK